MDPEIEDLIRRTDPNNEHDFKSMLEMGMGKRRWNAELFQHLIDYVEEKPDKVELFSKHSFQFFDKVNLFINVNVINTVTLKFEILS